MRPLNRWTRGDYAETFDPVRLKMPLSPTLQTFRTASISSISRLRIRAKTPAELVTSFTLNEELRSVRFSNVPNPTVDGKTFFTYHLAQHRIPSPSKFTASPADCFGRLSMPARVEVPMRRVGMGEMKRGCGVRMGCILYRVIAYREDGSRIEQVGKLAILR